MRCLPFSELERSRWICRARYPPTGRGFEQLAVTAASAPGDRTGRTSLSMNRGRAGQFPALADWSQPARLPRRTATPLPRCGACSISSGESSKEKNRGTRVAQAAVAQP